MRFIFYRSFFSKSCLRWRGHGIDFVVGSTIKFLQKKRPVSATMTKGDSVEFVELISDDEIDDDNVEELSKSTRSLLDQKELGFGNTKRVIPQEDLRKWKKALDILPGEFKQLLSKIQKIFPHLLFCLF